MELYFKFILLLFMLVAAHVAAKSHNHAQDEESKEGCGGVENISINGTESNNAGSGSEDEEDEDIDFDNDESGTAMSDDDKKKLIRLLSTEGESGWFERAKRVGGQLTEPSTGKKKDKPNKDLPKKIYKDAPTGLINGLKTKLNGVTDPLANNVKTSLNGLTSKWSDLEDDEREGIAGTLETITGNFDKFINAGDDPVGAVQGAIDIIGSIAGNFGPVGQLVSMGLGFVSAIMGLFGKAPEQPSIGEIVKKVIDKALAEHHDQTLTDRANGVIKALSESKSYLDGVAQVGTPLNLQQMTLASTRVPVVQGSEFMGELFSIANRLFIENSSDNAGKAIKYTELYAKMATIRDIILTQFISITGPDEDLKFDVQGLINIRKALRQGVRVLLENLYIVKFSNKILPYFDPENSPASDSYARALLDLGKFDRSMAGEYCIQYGTSGYDLDWQRGYKQFKLGGRPYLALQKHSNTNCYWKLVPHGNYIYSIVNKYKCKDKYDYCNAMLSFDGYDDKAYVNIDHGDPVLWEIWGYNFRRIQSKWGCSGSKYCNRELRIAKRRITGWSCFISSRCSLNVGQLISSDGLYYWRLKRRT